MKPYLSVHAHQLLDRPPRPHEAQWLTQHKLQGAWGAHQLAAHRLRWLRMCAHRRGRLLRLIYTLNDRLIAHPLPNILPQFWFRGGYQLYAIADVVVEHPECAAVEAVLKTPISGWPFKPTVGPRDPASNFEITATASTTME